MRIAYSCAGEGFGHATRTAVIGPLLQESHDIVYFIPETVKGFTSSRIGDAQYERIPHFAFTKRGERVLLFATVFRALPLALAFPLVLVRLVRKLHSLRIDAVISDFDPFLPCAARMLGIPVLQINHPGIVQRVLSIHPQALLTSLATRILEGPWNERMHVSFYGGDVGPIIRREVFARPISDEGFVLLNLKPCFRPIVLPILERMGIRYRLFPDPRADFLSALASCSCVLSSAGHQIIAESIALNKPIMVIPQGGQWEQQLNAQMVDRTGKGCSTTIDHLEANLPEFLVGLERYRSNILPASFTVTDSSQEIVRRIEDFLVKVRQKRYSNFFVAVAASARMKDAPPGGLQDSKAKKAV
jgi:UDP:flavonoid glycosyltransferase YjiC (YdhE family)